MIIFVKNTTMEKTEKQTAVEFYRNNLMSLVSGKTDFKTELEIFNQAKEMEKQQIIEAWDNGYDTGFGYLDSKFENAENYYNETFNK